MIFSLEALNARQGDCLIIYEGGVGTPHLIVVDGGPRGVFRTALRPRLEGLRKRLWPDQPLPLPLIVVSHIDNDHILGILDLAKHVQQESEQNSYRVVELWHNSFEDAVSPAPTSNEVAALSRGFSFPTSLKLQSLAVIQSVPRGAELREISRRLFWRLNHSLPGEPAPLIQAGDQGQKIGHDLRLTVLSPGAAQIESYRKEWREALQEERDLSQALARLDNAIFNLSSIVFLAEAKGKTMLLTGDSRGDLILKALEEAGLTDQGIFHCDVLKIPHHGSPRNSTEEFFQRVRASHYVVSGNGSQGNPSVETLGLLTKTRGAEEYTVWFTNLSDEIESFFQSDRATHSRNYRICPATERGGVSSVMIDLGSETPPIDG